MSTDDGLVVRGGPGGTTAHLADIDRCAQHLRNAATLINTAWFSLGRLQEELDRWSNAALVATPEGLNAVGVARQARTAVDGVRSGPRGLLPFASELRDDARDVDSARAKYGAAENFVVGAVRGLWDQVWDEMTTEPWLRLDVAFIPQPALQMLGYEVLAWRSGNTGARVQKYVRALTTAITLTAPGQIFSLNDPVPYVSKWLGTGLSLLNGHKEVVVQPVIGGVRTGPPPRGVQDITERLERNVDATGRGASEGTEALRAAATPSWLVTIPGTQEGALVGGTSPFNNLSNVVLMAGALADSSKAVLGAMAAAGVGENEPVVLAGHSQGGLVAQQVARMGTYSVAGVLTVGSPVGAGTQRPTVPTLAIEHGSDAVPALDGRDNPDDPLLTTVWTKPGGDADIDPLLAHSTQAYATTAGVVDASQEDSIVAWRDLLTETLGENSTTTSRQYSSHLR